MFQLLDIEGDNIEALNVVPARLPKTINYVSLNARVATFETWNFVEIQHPIQLAEAGMDLILRVKYSSNVLINCFQASTTWVIMMRSAASIVMSVCAAGSPMTIPGMSTPAGSLVASFFCLIKAMTT